MIPMDDETRSRLNAEEAEIQRSLSKLFPRGLPTPHLYHDREGRPIGLGDWVALWGDWDYRRVAVTMVGPHRISTVWTGLAALSFGAFCEGRPPLIFETKVVNDEVDSEADDDRGWWDHQWRYSCELDAITGHEATVRHVEDVTGLTRTPEGG